MRCVVALQLLADADAAATATSEGSDDGASALMAMIAGGGDLHFSGIRVGPGANLVLNGGVSTSLFSQTVVTQVNKQG